MAPAENSASVSEQQLRSYLAGIPGLDLDVGLEAMRGNVTKYARLLALFADGNQHHADQILSRLAAGEWHSIRLIAHSLHGSAGMLGAVGVAEAARAVLSEMENHLDAEEVARLCRSLAESLTTLVTHIQRESTRLTASPAVAAVPARLTDVPGQEPS